MDSRGVAELISLVFNPPVVAAPTFLCLILLQRSENSLALILIAVSFGVLIPLTIVYGLSKRGMIPDFWASRRETRAIPFLGALCSYLLGTVALVAAKSSAIITSLMLCYVGNTLIMMLISFRWKISVHASGITGPATALLYSAGAIAFPFLLLVVPVGWARIKLGAHTPAQVAAGASLAIVATWLQLGVYLSVL